MVDLIVRETSTVTFNSFPKQFYDCRPGYLKGVSTIEAPDIQ
jgi:hypothetical protein